ncbi:MULTISPECIES: ArsA-related P-loop ATPase [Mycobacterium]|uniref:Putative ATPase n=1 Tax=Mycobacterium indicus pranii (strain DSM 45239 / MTCC 9506) TaxID=1232724 RepID=J9W687_MYCIP|nr:MULTISPECIES: ArsA family ATPase [Mycobacterium]AFS12539.1 Putative ATPase [Mycobacterium intracellulare subsp. intracellulare MTCC 9506]ETZ39548.1 cobQ/CobB/MinD/ParA nucleotide binding domain protein [Mycobacterium intracellulare MIN_061107_1834]MCA2305530.1 ArsA family ATPase [Mycobacterium intracellulare]MCA2347804.1 ArsA family ATPase [Mycobacterium intracellulare]UEB24495.1 ArsA family ATPase [Mycobacterium intracellulare]
MATTSSGGSAVGWPARLTKARLHFVTGKGGTGKSTIAAALALTLAAGGRKVLLVEVEGRQGIAQLFDVPPLPYQEVKIATAERGGQVNALAIDIEAAFLEYLDMFYNLGIAGRAMRRIGAIEFATTIAPGLRDVLLTGKIKETVIRVDKNRLPVYDAIVVDAPPTGRIARFLDVTKAVSDLAKGGPVHSQADGVVKLLHSEQTAIHLVTLLEALPVQETLEAIEELADMQLPIGSVIVNRNIASYLQPADLAKAAEGDVDADSVRAGLEKSGITLNDNDFAGLLTETIEHATVIATRSEIAQQLDALKVPRLQLPAISDGVDLGSLYELSESLAQQGVR